MGGVATAATFNEADEETSVGATTYSYDANGNETGSSAGETRGYNAKNQTISITGLNGTLTPIGYEDAGQGERTQAGSSAYVNSAQGVSSETKGGATIYYTRTPGGKLVSQRTPTATYYYLFDGQGSVVGLVDTSGTVVASYSYDPYGQTVVKTGSAADGNPWRYTGAYLDSTGLYKMGERYYDSARGRFTQRDPAGTGYGYASDNPVNITDPTGLDDCSDPNGSCNAPPPGQDVADPCGPDCSPAAEVPRNLIPSENEARRQLGLSRADFREAIHAVKDANGIPPNGDLLFRTTEPGKGDVYYNGENVGNLYDEIHINGGLNGGGS